jgi:N4-gp56 family major capsid protein
MTLATFIPEVWSAQLLISLQKSLVFQVLANRDYEGDIANQGDTVHITSIGDPTISNYTVGSTLTYEQLTTADRTLIVDQAKAFSFEVDDIDKRQAAGSVIGTAMARAAYRLADVTDQFLSGLTVNAAPANQIANTSITTPDLAYKFLTKLNTALNVANVPTQGRVCIIPPWFNEVMSQDLRFTSAVALDPQGSVPSAALTGFVRHAVGCDIYVSNNLVVPGANRNLVVMGINEALTFAEQISQVEALRLQTTFADAIRGLHLYGGKVTRPEAIATLDASSV